MQGDVNLFGKISLFGKIVVLSIVKFI